MRMSYPWVLLALAMSLLSSRAAADEDAALVKDCPGLESWAATHPRKQDDAVVVNSDAQRIFSKPALHKELTLRANADQKARSTFAAAGPGDKKAVEAMLTTDADNLAWLKATIHEHGFPTMAEIGEDGMSNAWLLVQHADADPVFQAAVLATLEARPESSGIRKSEIAMLTDRVLTGQGKPQRYATQFERTAQGEFVPMATEDLAGVDQRRAAMGLMPLSVYQCVLRVSYASEAIPAE